MLAPMAFHRGAGGLHSFDDLRIGHGSYSSSFGSSARRATCGRLQPGILRRPGQRRYRRTSDRDGGGRREDVSAALVVVSAHRAMAS